MKNIEEINSYDDIETYYDVQIPEFIQTILENRAEALKHCVNYKKEIERLNNIIKEVREWANKTIFYFDFEEEITKHAFDLLYTKQGQELLEILTGKRGK